jgi:pimeloyl-ACP methyl ester carboxylesterase
MARRATGLSNAIERHPLGAAALATGAALGGIALATALAGRQAEREHPPRGEFAEIDGVNVHYLEAGHGTPVLLLHGNGAMAEDFVISGLFHRLAQDFHVIAPDRPGFGYTERPRGRVWTPDAQADLIRGLLDHLEVRSPIVIGHSWGNLVAVSLALEAPVRGLVLLGGYYYPSPRADVAILGAPAIPVVGDVMRYTISPIAGRAMLPEIYRRLFAPRPVPARFTTRFPVALALRPSQIRASAEETAMMIPSAAALQDRYRELDLPTVIMAGEGDTIVTAEDQSERLHQDIRGSDLKVLPGLGHMFHYAATERIKQVVDTMARS